MEQNKKDNKSQIDKLKQQFGGGGNKNAPKKGGKPKFNFYWIYALIFVAFLVLNYVGSSPVASEKKGFSDLKEMLVANDVDHLEVVNDKIVRIYLSEEALDKEEYEEVAKTKFTEAKNKGPHYQFEMPREALQDAFDRFYESNPELAENNGRIDDSIVYTEQHNYLGEILAWVLPVFLFIALWLFIMRRMSGGAGGPGGQIFNIGKSKAQVYDKESKVRVTFKDVAGLEEAKEEINEIVDFLKSPEKYTKLGAKIPRGVLLSGSPGTGKTLLAKAVAGEAKVPFFSLSGSDFVEMFVGVGASRVRDLFKQAKEKSPCIIFIDEIDAIGRARGKSNFSGGNDERENTLNALLTEMDGFGTNQHVILMAATNRADILDRALLRPGRFDRTIYVDLPEVKERKAIFKVHTKDKKIEGELDFDFLARQTPGFSGADIANVCNEAALIAARKNHTAVNKQDFLDAIDRIIGGLEKKSKIISPKEKKTIAYHEAGHATVSWLLEHASPLVKVTIVPRGRSLGAAWYLPEERQITTTNQLLDEMCAALGGRAAEEIMFGEISTGALSDLEKVTKQARAMVTIYGLNDKLGNITYYDSSGQQEYNFDKPYSEKTAEVIDKEIHEIIEKQYQRALDILRENKNKLEELAEYLLDKEVIFKENLEKIYGKRQWDDAHIIEDLADETEDTVAEYSIENKSGAENESLEEGGSESSNKEEKSYNKEASKSYSKES
ncbi:MAG: ATP-dependent zinc metalloprotease FtsH [Schleiferiaceae bacterium]|jgi:cell division protease FtsH|nr:ATP-dependent zinc metalloprotease FtsH [Schleiferiaceae bacterium]